MAILTIVNLKIDYIYKANKTYENLVSFEEEFIERIKVINYVKCALLRKEDLDDFDVDGIYVSVYGKSDGYDLFFDKYNLSIEIYDDMIINMSIA